MSLLSVNNTCTSLYLIYGFPGVVRSRYVSMCTEAAAHGSVGGAGRIQHNCSKPRWESERIFVHSESRPETKCLL